MPCHSIPRYSPAGIQTSLCVLRFSLTVFLSNFTVFKTDSLRSELVSLVYHPSDPANPNSLLILPYPTASFLTVDSTRLKIFSVIINVLLELGFLVLAGPQVLHII